MTRPLVSVIIPVYNAEKYLMSTINSVLGQTYEPLEIIAVNDGSKDKSLEILQSYGRQIKVIDQTNSGQAAARNRGVAHSRGELVAFLDHDDIWDSQKTERQVATLLNYPTAVGVYCDHRNIDGKGQITGRTGAVKHPRFSGNIFLHLIRGNCIITASLVIVRRHNFLAAGGFDETQPSSVDDWQLWMALAAQGPFLYMLETLVSYRRHDNNLSAHNLGYSIEAGRLHALRAIRPLVEAEGNSRLMSVYLETMYESNLSMAWHCQLRGERIAALRNYFACLKVKPHALRLWLKAGVLSLLPSKALLALNQAKLHRK